MIQGILFDIDGTLLLSNDAHAHAWQEAFAESGFTVEFAMVRRLIGMGGDKLIDTLFPEMNDEPGVGTQIAARRTEIFLEKYVAGLQPAPGARDLVQAVQAAGLKAMVASSASKRELDALLKAAGVDDLLTEATTSDDAEHSKPDSDIVEVALEKIGLSADQVVLLGDTPYDIASAAKVGVRCIALRCGGWIDDELVGALAIYDDPADVFAHRADASF